MCLISPYLAYGMSLYCLASAYYMIRTQSIGVPFKNSLTKEQLNITSCKDKSTNVRRNIFFQGIGCGIAILILFRPFRNC